MMKFKRINIRCDPLVTFCLATLNFQPHNSVPERYNLPCSDAAFDSTAGLVAICTENYCIQLFSMLDDREISLVSILKNEAV